MPIFKKYLPHAIVAGAVLAGFVRGIQPWLKGKAEWRYYRQLVHEPLAQVTGPDKPIFGYLPGCKGLLWPFVQTEPVGYFAFALMNAAACVGIVVLVHRHYSPADRNPLALPWLSICAGVPTWFTLQNNQVVAPAVFLTLLAFSLLRTRRDIGAGGVFALAALLKTLPLPILLFPLVSRRWRMVVSAALALGLLSLVLAALTDGWAGSVACHLRWPGQVAAQNPSNALKAGAEPLTFYLNQSPAAEVVRLARLTGVVGLTHVHTVFCVVSLLAMLAVSMTGRDDESLFWHRVAGWLAWVAYAAPFGRYYYLVLLVPALYGLGLRALARSGRPQVTFAVMSVLCVSLLVARDHNPLYAVATSATLLACLVCLAREVRRPGNPATAGVRAGTAPS